MRWREPVIRCILKRKGGEGWDGMVKPRALGLELSAALQSKHWIGGYCNGTYVSAQQHFIWRKSKGGG